ncbi:MAG: CPBP family intramembrane metalloprotease [Aquincola sp.]|nr:CPBP family intramembrane metalloprotease [Aquincola sp.]
MAPAPTLRLGRQAATCALFCALALAVMAWRHPDDWLADTRTGWPLPAQLALAAAATAAAWLLILIVRRSPRWRQRVPVPSSMQGLDLSGYRPLAVALLAGIGEELLFRAALLPAVGLLGSSALFALAHARTALLAGPGWGLRSLYLAQTLLAGLALGLVYLYLGLLVAVVLHVLIDWVGLSLMAARSNELARAARP